ncbi:MAG TPA: imidazoleglycerol-phosphate dehydratase [Candidatus Thermoplasmatota archaeon]|nr:imidazoleglycerol-phosphate dehydratase [Candidatus Thermoplasmatota archaeon]
MVELKRETKETRIRIKLEKGTGRAAVQLPDAFARHMFETFAKWSGFDLTLEAESLDGIGHHVIEDAAIALGRAFRQAVDTGRIERVGHAYVPMDDALVMAAIDLVERPYYHGQLPDPMMDHVMRSFATEGGLTLHVVVIHGRDEHHIVEAAFKAVATAVRKATEARGERLSTKGDVRLT